MPTQDEPGRRLALIVASSDYRDPTLHQLRAPGRDASDLAEVLGNPAIGIFDVRTLMDTPSDQLLRGIAQFCRQAGPGDLLMVYLSCHGVLDDRGRLYYATIDTERALLSATAVSAHWLSEQLDDCRARQKILVLDCCHSGAFARGSKGDSALALKDRFSGRGKIVLTASGATEYSFEGASVVGEGVRSVFTRAVVDGLRTGQADRDKDGLVTVNDLYHHVYDTVRAAEPRQTPKLWAFGAEGDLLVAHSPRGPIVEPAPLPEDLRLTLENPRLVIRESGVKVLAELLDHGEPGLALTARQILQRISEEDHPRIAALARAAQDADHGQAVTQLEAQEQARQQAERAAAQRRQQIEQLQQQIRDRAAAQDWDAVLAVSDQLAGLDPDAADPDALASTAREQITRRQQAEPVDNGAPDVADDRAAGRLSSILLGVRGGKFNGPSVSRRRVIVGMISVPAAAGIAIAGWELSQDNATASHPSGRLSQQSTPEPTSLAQHPGAKIWSFQAPGPVNAGPVVANNVVYAANDNENGGPDSHNVYAFHAVSGSLIWKFANAGSSYTGIAVANGLVYIGSDFHNVYAFRATDGTLAWRFVTGDLVLSTPAVANGVVYVGSADKKVYALNAVTGHGIWSYTTGGYVNSGLAVASNTVYAGSTDGYVHALRAASGEQIWSFAIGGVPRTDVATANSSVYVGSDDKNVYALDATTGQKRWNYATGGSVQSGIAVDSGVVYVGSNDKNVYALDATTGQKRWNYATGGSVQSGIAVAAQGIVYAGSTDGRLYAVRA